MMISSIWHSIFIALTAVIVAFFLMLPFSYYFANHKSKWQFPLEVLILLPLVLPPTVVGLILLNLLGKNRPIGHFIYEMFDFSFIFSLAGAILATTIIISPILYQGLKSAFLSIDHELIWAAETLAASRRKIFLNVILPNCWQPILASILLGFCRALGEFGASLMVAGYIEGKTNTISSSIYFMVQQGDTKSAIYLGIFNIFIGVLMLLIIHFLTVRQKYLIGGK